MSEGKNSEILSLMRTITKLQPKAGAVHHTHVTIRDGRLSATDGIVVINVPVPLDLNLVPNSIKLRDALVLIGDEDASFVEVDGELSISSSSSNVVVECTGSGFAEPTPDKNEIPVTDKLLAAMSTAATATDPGSDKAIFRGVCLLDECVYGCDGKIIIEAVHDCPGVKGIIIPVATLKALKLLGKPCGLGYSHSSVTFWYEDGSWLNSRLFDTKYPDTMGLFDPMANPRPIPEGFFDAIKKVMRFDSNGYILLKDGRITVGKRVGTKVDGVTDGGRISGELLCRCDKWADLIDMSNNKRKATLIGEGARATIMKCV